MHAEEVRVVSGELRRDELGVVIFVLQDWAFEFGCAAGHFHALQKLGSDQGVEVRVGNTTIPIIGNVSAVHNFAKDVNEIFPRNFATAAQIVLKNLTADSKIAIVERIGLREALRAEAAATKHE